MSRPLPLNCSLCLTILSLITHLLSCLVVRADIPQFIGDGELVDRSKSIVIGRLQGDSVRKIQHPRGYSEYHATLIVKDILKGEFRDRQTTLMIQHGLRVSTEEGKVSLWCNSTMLTGIPVAADARQDQIWFLRQLQSADSQPDAPRMWGVYGLHEVQNVDLAEYFKILLSPQPESKLRDYLKSHPRLAVRAVEYLESREVARISKKPDLAIRFQKLLPYYLGAAHDATQRSAGRALIDGGPESGPYLMAAFHSHQHRRQRTGIIFMWAHTGYTGCADLLVRLLDENHRTYLDLHGRLEREGLESGVEAWYVKQLPQEVRAAIYALAEIGDPRAEKLIDETRRRWKEIPSAGNEILEVCDLGMERIQERKRKAAANSDK